MAEPDLLQRQREILRAFRQATARRTQAEADAEACRKADREGADAALDQVRQTAAAQLTEARKVLEAAQASLTKAGLQHLLGQIQPTPPTLRLGAHPAQELPYHVSTAAETSKRAQADVEELLQLQRKWKERRADVITFAIVFFILVVTAILALIRLSGRYGM